MHPKKNKNSGKNKEGLGLGLNRNGGTMPQKKRIQNYDNIPNGASEEVIKIFKKCKKGLDKMKELKYYKMYYDPRKPEEPCIADIEKKLNNYEYKSLYDFIMDVRKIWNYHFNSDKLNNEITSKMSDEWEKICADLENSNNEMSVATIKKRTDRITKDVHEFKDNVIRENLPAPIKRNNQQIKCPNCRKLTSMHPKYLMNNPLVFSRFLICCNCHEKVPQNQLFFYKNNLKLLGAASIEA